MATTGLQLNVGADVTGAVTGINQLNKSLKTLPQGANSASFALTNLGRVAQDAPFGFIGIQNNINPLLESFQRLKQETGSTGSALKALAGSFVGPAGLGVAVSLITAAITFFIQAKQKAASATKALKEETSALDSAIKSAVKSVTDESQKVSALVTALQTQNLTRTQQVKLLGELNKIAPEYFGNLQKEKGFVDALSTSYFLYRQNISKAIQARLLESDLEPLQKRLGEIEKIIKANNDELDLRKAIGASEQVQRRGIVLIEGKEVNINELYRERAGIQAAIFGIQGKINSSNTSYINGLINGNNVAKTGAASVNEELQRQINFNQILIKQAATLIGFNEDPTIKLAPKQQRGVDINNANQTSALVITPEALKRQGEYALLLDEISAKYARQLELTNQISSTISNGINQGIDTFFNALANNQDPFEALAQSAKRLVVELAAAVVKALALKAIASLLSSGTTTALDGLAGGLGGNGGGILSLILRGDLITGAVGGNASRRRRF